MSIENARKEIIDKLRRDIRYYQNLAEEYGVNNTGCSPPGPVTYGERAEAHREALAVFEAVWERTVVE